MREGALSPSLLSCGWSSDSAEVYKLWGRHSCALRGKDIAIKNIQNQLEDEFWLLQ